jgi:hypothetical protein
MLFSGLAIELATDELNELATSVPGHITDLAFRQAVSQSVMAARANIRIAAEAPNADAARLCTIACDQLLFAWSLLLNRTLNQDLDVASCKALAEKVLTATGTVRKLETAALALTV